MLYYTKKSYKSLFQMQANGSIRLYVLNNLHVHIHKFKKDDSLDGIVLRFNGYTGKDNVNKIIGK